MKEKISKKQLRKDNAALVAVIQRISDRLDMHPILDSVDDIQAWHHDVKAVLEAHHSSQ